MWVRERKWAKMLHRALCGKASSQISHFSSQVIQNELRKMIHTESVFSVMLFLFICSDVAAVSNISASCLHQWNKLQDNEKEAAIEDLLFLTVNVVAFLSHNEGKWIGYYLRPISTYEDFWFLGLYKKCPCQLAVHFSAVCIAFIQNEFSTNIKAMRLLTYTQMLYPKTHTKQVLHWWRTAQTAQTLKSMFYIIVCVVNVWNPDVLQPTILLYQHVTYEVAYHSSDILLFYYTVFLLFLVFFC